MLHTAVQIIPFEVAAYKNMVNIRSVACIILKCKISLSMHPGINESIRHRLTFFVFIVQNSTMLNESRVDRSSELDNHQIYYNHVSMISISFVAKA